MSRVWRHRRAGAASYLIEDERRLATCSFAPTVRATLIYNPKAGDGGPTAARLVEAFSDIGWSVDLASRSELERVLERKPEVLAVAGGDGTVSKAFMGAVGSDTCVAIVPTGTANNIARSLDLVVGDPLAAIAKLAHVREIALDVAEVNGVARRFVEVFGIGAFAKLLHDESVSHAASVAAARRQLGFELKTYAPQPISVEIDGKLVKGAYLFALVMNARSFGPALTFAPDARMDDGVLDVVLVGEDSRRDLVRALEGEDGLTPLAVRHRGEHIRLRTQVERVHIDDTPHVVHGTIEIGLARAPARVLVPS